MPPRKSTTPAKGFNFTQKFNLKEPKQDRSGGNGEICLSDSDIKRRITGMTKTSMKRWLMQAHAAGTVSDDQVTFFFYANDLGAA